MSPVSRMVVAKNFPYRPLAEAGVEFLRVHHITAIIQSSDIAGTGTPQGFDLYVREGDALRARELLEQVYDGI